MSGFVEVVEAQGAAAMRHVVDPITTQQLDTFADMRDQRDQALIRAEAAEDELVRSIAHVKQLNAALTEVRSLAAKENGDYSAAIISIACEALDGDV